MDNQNQDPQTPKPIIPTPPETLQSKVEPKVIQPSESFVSEMNVASNNSVNPNTVQPTATTTPTPLTNGQTPTQQPSISAQPSVITGGEAPIGTPFTPTLPVSEDKPKKGNLKILTFGIILLIVIAAAVLLLADKSLQATVLREKFTPYTFVTEKGDKFSINFYRGSKVENLSIGNGQTATELLSPVVKPYPVPILLFLNGRPNNSNATAQQLLQEGENCTASIFNIEAFTVYIPSVGVNATFCTESQDIVYNSFFGTSSSVYNIVFEEDVSSINASNISSPKTQALAKAIIKNKLNTNDIKAIAESFKPLPN